MGGALLVTCSTSRDESKHNFCRFEDKSKCLVTNRDWLLVMDRSNLCSWHNSPTKCFLEDYFIFVNIASYRLFICKRIVYSIFSPVAASRDVAYL